MCWHIERPFLWTALSQVKHSVRLFLHFRCDDNGFAMIPFFLDCNAYEDNCPSFTTEEGIVNSYGLNPCDQTIQYGKHQNDHYCYVGSSSSMVLSIYLILLLLILFAWEIYTLIFYHQVTLECISVRQGTFPCRNKVIWTNTRTSYIIAHFQASLSPNKLILFLVQSLLTCWSAIFTQVSWHSTRRSNPWNRRQRCRIHCESLVRNNF